MQHAAKQAEQGAADQWWRALPAFFKARNPVSAALSIALELVAVHCAMLMTARMMLATGPGFHRKC